jgi:hypothetical protein
MRLPYDTDLLGFDLFLDVSGDLTFDEIVCAEPFDCEINYDENAGKVNIYAIVPPQAMKTFERGNLTMVELLYSSDSKGTLRVNTGFSKSVVSRPYSDTNLLRQDPYIFEIAENE